MNKTMYQKTIKGKITEWNIDIRGNVITVVWGQLGSEKKQTKITKIKAKAHTTAKEQAQIEYDRELIKRAKKGYYPTIKEAEAIDYDADIDLNNIPTSFSPAKPIQQKPVLNPDDAPADHVLNKPLQLVYKNGNLWFQRKANGIRAYYVKTRKGCKLYSRTMVEMSAHFPDLMEHFDSFEVDCNIPYNSMLDMEITIGGGNTFEQCMLAQSLAPGDKAKATDVKKNAEHACERFKEMTQPLVAVVFDVIYWDSKRVNKQSYEHRYAILDEAIQYFDGSVHESSKRDFKAVAVIPDNFNFFDIAVDHMITAKWEGLVIWDKTMKGGFTANSKPKRLKGCWKWKNVKEDDFFIIDLEPERGNDDLVGALIIGQYNTKGKVVNCGRVGSGLKKEDKIVAWDWIGEVFEIHFDHRMKENADGQRCLQFPRIIRQRIDKRPEECVLEED